MSHPDKLHDKENEYPDDVEESDISISDVIKMKEESEMDDESDAEIDARLEEESRDLDRRADIFNNGCGI